MTCLWELDTSCLPPEWNTRSEAVRLRAHTLASNTMARLTGYRVGTCPVTIRPCRSQCEHDYDASFFGSGLSAPIGVVNWGGRWGNTACGPSCRHPCTVELPGPVGRIDSVKVDGTVLADELYRVDNGVELTWLGTEPCPFPRSQNVALDDDQPGTMSVTYVNAYLPDVDGLYAMTALAVEFAASCCGENCRLPPSVTSIVRQGISMEIASGAFRNGKTGIYEVDAYTALWNPRGLTHPPQVWSPDQPAHRRVGR